ncbi:hypothetical protein BBAD15_g11910 [Beauveria bassiana D1-5]|uniref:DDE-1 domain-containing protein n=1 Tax=Beauveria bassiana D1-5 TaxID=1245745 RepID=A0A0A2V4Y2_BEABA|nr:hypothetical protein BBAD15_g11910 [Beauveria bassiana D1-5]
MVINQYFYLLQEVVLTYGITPNDTWNMDESGFRIGVSKDELVITKSRHKQYFASPENRESATVIEAISAAGAFIPAFVIVAGKQQMGRWYSDELYAAMKVSVTSSGYTNDEITFKWLQHFQSHSIKCQVGAKRLLILDGHGSHHTIEFIKYCEDSGIIPFGMPPHLTHLLQPLDVVIFQPLKYHYQRGLDVVIRDGITTIGKLEFLQLIQKAREKTLRSSLIISAFRNTGIYPYNPLVVLQQLQQPNRARTPSPQPLWHNNGSSPFNTPYTLRQADKLANQVTEALQNSPLDAELTGKLQALIKGSLYHATTSHQLQRDAERQALRKEQFWGDRSKKARQLQYGGTLSVEQARHMVRDKELKEEQEIAARVARRERAAQQAAFRVFKEAAKKARDKRKNGVLERLFVHEKNGRVRRLLCR